MANTEASYTPTYWVNDGEATEEHPYEYINAENLNNIETGVANAVASANALDARVTPLESSVSSINSQLARKMGMASEVASAYALETTNGYAGLKIAAANAVAAIDQTLALTPTGEYLYDNKAGKTLWSLDAAGISTLLGRIRFGEQAFEVSVAQPWHGQYLASVKVDLASAGFAGTDYGIVAFAHSTRNGAVYSVSMGAKTATGFDMYLCCPYQSTNDYVVVYWIGFKY